jgi:hypothetical protein
MDLFLQLARNDPSVVDLNDWKQQHGDYLHLNAGGTTLLGKCLVGNTHLRVFIVSMSDLDIRAEKVLIHGLANSQLEAIQLMADTSDDFKSFYLMLMIIMKQLDCLPHCKFCSSSTYHLTHEV